MRTAITAAVAAVVILTGVWSASVITAAPPRPDQSAPAQSSIDVMQMMKAATFLPSEQYDAY